MTSRSSPSALRVPVDASIHPVDPDELAIPEVNAGVYVLEPDAPNADRKFAHLLQGAFSIRF